MADIQHFTAEMALLATTASIMEVSLTDIKNRVFVDMDSRQVAVKGKFGNDHDHLAKKIVLEITRYVGDVDLADHTCAIHWGNGENGGIMPVTKRDLSEDGKILVLWELTGEFTEYSGDIVFAVHFFSVVDGNFTFHSSSDAGHGKLGATFNASDHGQNNITPSEIEKYIAIMNEFSLAIDAKIASVDAKVAEVDDTLSASGKAADAAVVGQKIGQLSSEIDELKESAGNENKMLIEEVDKQVVLSTNVDVVPFRNSSLGNGKVYSAESESFYFFCIKGHTYKWTSNGNRQDVGFFFEIPTVGKPTYNSEIYSYAREVEFTAPITGYCMVYHNSGVSDDVVNSVVVTTKNNINELRTKNEETNEFIDELYGQLSSGIVLTTRLSGYNLAGNKVTKNSSESFYFKVFKGVSYVYNDSGDRQNVIFTKEKPQVEVKAYNGITYSYPREVEFIAPITGYCVIHHHATVNDNVAQSVEVNVANTLVDQCEDSVMDRLGTGGLKLLPDIYHFIDEMYGQLSDGIVQTTRLSGYNFISNKITANNSEIFYFKVFKDVVYKYNDTGTRQNVIFTKEKPGEGVVAYDNKTYSYPRDVEFISPITGYCVIHHNHIIDDSVAQSVEVKVMNTLVDKCEKDVLEALGTGGLKMLPDIYEFVDELHGQLSDGTVLTTRLSGYNFAHNKITVNNSESFYFKVFKDVAYKFNDDGTRQNVIFVKERPQEGVVAYDNTTHSYPRGVAFVAPITGYCVIHHNHVVDDSVARSVQVNVADTLVDQCEDNVLGILEANDVRTLPSIYLEEIDRVGDIVANQDFGLSFLFATDIHIRDEAHLYKMDIMGKCGEFVDLIILNGDIVDGSEKEDVSYVKKLLKATIDRTRNPVSKTYSLMGNHDNNFLKVNATADNSNAITTRMFTNLTCKGETNAVYDSKHPMQVYYYIDFPMYKIRMICLNVCLAFEDDGSREDYTNVWGFTTDEMYWMRDKALRFDDKEDSEEWGVVLCSHISILRDENVEYHTPKSITFNGMMKAFQNGSSYTEPDTAIGFGTDNVFDFSDQGGREVICYLAGHLHYDLVSTANDLQIPIISTTSGHASQSTLVETQTPTTPITTASAPIRTDDRKNVNSECFDLVKIDRQKRKIICTRYGAGNSREIDY